MQSSVWNWSSYLTGKITGINESDLLSLFTFGSKFDSADKSRFLYDLHVINATNLVGEY